MRTLLHHTLVALGLFGLWVVLSGKLDAFHLALGAACAIGVALLSGRRLYTEVEVSPGRRERVWLTSINWPRAVTYLATMSWEILRANLAVAKKILGPISRLQPRILHLRPGLKSELGQVVLADTIILTPGTAVLDVTPEGDFVIHALDAGSERRTTEGPLERRVAWAFEPPEHGGLR